MENFNHRKTPLGEKFGNTDFPLEPHAWDDMEKLLAAQDSKPPLSIWNNKTLFLLILMGFSFFAFYVSLNRKIALKSSEITEVAPPSTIKRLLYIPPQDMNTPSVFFQKNALYEHIYVEKVGNNSGKIKNSEALLTDRKVKNPALFETPNTLKSTSDNAHSFLKVLDNQNSTQLPPQYKSQFEALSVPFKNNNSDLKRGSADKINEASKSETFENEAENGMAISKENKEGVTRDVIQSIDNQGNMIQEASENALLPLDLLALNPVFSSKLVDYNTFNSFAKNIIPLSKLLNGPRYQLDIGFGRATYNAPKNINHFRLGFQYRLTPLFGLGVSTNYSLKVNSRGEKGYLFTSDIEGLLYFVNKKKMDFIISAGYGYRQLQLPNDILQSKEGKGKGFTLGLVTQYRFNKKWVAGLRIDVREIARLVQDPAFVLTLGKRF